MKLALIGYGAMGCLVEARAADFGCEVGRVVASREAEMKAEEIAELLRGHDAAIDFSVADAVVRNAEACALAGVPLVEGTTGWLGQLEEVRQRIEAANAVAVYGANFSVGVNLFFRVVEQAAELFGAAESYEAFVEEAHHSRKLDAPSGTALKLIDAVKARTKRDPSVASTRAGHIPGTHRVGFDSADDQVVLTHTARTREGFAAGALRAAKWAAAPGRAPGLYEFTQVLDDMLAEEKAVS